MSITEVFYMSAADIREHGEESVWFDSVSAEYASEGWYYWYCEPGCLPDSEPIGPFQSEREAQHDIYKNDDGIALYTAPSYWASYLVNSDASGLTDEEQRACDAWIDYIAPDVQPCVPVDCYDAGFIGCHDAYEFYPYASDCYYYVFFANTEVDA